MLCLWCRQAATAPNRPLDWETPYDEDETMKKTKNKKKKEKKKKKKKLKNNKNLKRYSIINLILNILL